MGEPSTAAVMLKHLPPGRIDDLHEPCSIDDEQAGGEAVDDLRAERLRGFGPLGHRPFLRAQLLNRVLQGNGEERRLPRITQTMTGVSRRRDESEQRPGHDRDQHGDERCEPEQRVCLRIHW